MSSRRKGKSFNKQSLLQQALNKSPDTLVEDFYKYNQEITSNSPEAFHVKPISVIIDGDRNKNKLSKEPFIFPISTTKMCKIPSFNKACQLFHNKLNDKSPVTYENMTQVTDTFLTAPNSSVIICNIERNLYESSHKFIQETNKENLSEIKATRSYTLCSKCTSLEQKTCFTESLPLLNNELPSVLSDNILDMKEELKAKEVLPDDLKCVNIDPNLFSDINNTGIESVIALYDK